MNRSIRTVPGTVFPADDIAAEGGEAFLDKVFYVSDGVMLSTVREITGQDTMALQNWVKRKWVPNPVKKTYDRERLARILIINALRDTLQIARILYLLKYINGTEPEDRIIPESRLYGLFCRVTGGVLRQGSGDLSRLDEEIDTALADFEEPVGGAGRRLRTTLRIMVGAYYAALVKGEADRLLDEIGADPEHTR